MTASYAPGKVILFGEHSVVYGRPAIAVPVTQVRARATVEDARQGQGILIRATDLHLEHRYGTPLKSDHPADPLDATVRYTLGRLGIESIPDLNLTVSSTIPIARGLGSGAAVATAIVRALLQHLGQALAAQDISDLVYQVEVIHHGTPSGIDNTVVAFEQPVYFVKGQPIEMMRVARPFSLVIGDTGVSSPTKVVVADVRRLWQKDRTRYDTWFDDMGAIATRAKEAITAGQITRLGPLMDENHELLQAIGVSSPALDRLVSAARAAGASGAKLCGAGRGGNMIALAAPQRAKNLAAALRNAGAVSVIVSKVR